MRNWKAILWIIALLCGSVWTGHAQRTIMAKQDTVISSDSTVTAVVPGETAKVDSTVKAVLSAAGFHASVNLSILKFRAFGCRLASPTEGEAEGVQTRS